MPAARTESPGVALARRRRVAGRGALSARGVEEYRLAVKLFGQEPPATPLRNFQERSRSEHASTAHACHDGELNQPRERGSPGRSEARADVVHCETEEAGQEQYEGREPEEPNSVGGDAASGSVARPKAL